MAIRVRSKQAAIFFNKENSEEMAKKAGVKSNGKLKKGYKYAKGGKVVKAKSSK